MSDVDRGIFPHQEPTEILILDVGSEFGTSKGKYKGF